MSPESPSSPPQSHGPHCLTENRSPRRAAWRQRLVQAERGLVGGVRSDSSFFVHFFGATIVLAASGVLGLGRMQWAIVLACLTLVLCAEMFNHALRALVHDNTEPPGPAAQRVLGMGSAAVLVAIVGAVLVIGLVFWERAEQLFPG